jgi:hypothetical protein
MYPASIWQGYILEEKMRQQSVTDKVKLEDPNISHWYASYTQDILCCLDLSRRTMIL